MSPYQPPGGRSFIARLLGAAVCLLVGVLVLQWAVQVIEHLAVPLIIIAGLAGGACVLVRWLRGRDNGW
ncbi:MAG: hypothetical protein JWP74_515 [Marmoricola sp.]|nr:hypothetical protein [Marmoricola sp.]